MYFNQLAFMPGNNNHILFFEQSKEFFHHAAYYSNTVAVDAPMRVTALKGFPHSVIILSLKRKRNQ